MKRKREYAITCKGGANSLAWGAQPEKIQRSTSYYFLYFDLVEQDQTVDALLKVAWHENWVVDVVLETLQLVSIQNL